MVLAGGSMDGAVVTPYCGLYVVVVLLVEENIIRMSGKK